MNTTDVLKTAYNPEPTTTKSSAEQRYGGPMRSRTEMFDYYSRFYRDPLPHNVDLHNDKVFETSLFSFFKNFSLLEFC